MVGEALYDLFARVQVLLGVAGQQASGAVEPRLLAQADQCVGQHAPLGPGVAHVAGGDDRHARGGREIDGAAIGALLIAPAVPRHIDPQAAGEVGARAVEQRGGEPLVAARERAQVRRVLLHLGPGDERLSLP